MVMTVIIVPNLMDNPINLMVMTVTIISNQMDKSFKSDGNNCDNVPHLTDKLSHLNLMVTTVIMFHF